MSIDNDFKRGSRGASSIMEGEVTPEQVERFMETSFYLPVDILKSKHWLVLPIKVMTGKEFEARLGTADYKHLHCVEDVNLLTGASFVAVSIRRHKSGLTTAVAKIWYGAAPK